MAPEREVVQSSDVEHARTVVRPAGRDACLSLANYRRNLLRTEFKDENLDTASDDLIDALVVHGDSDAVRVGLGAHLDANAEHVCAHVLTMSTACDKYRAGLQELAKGPDLA